jgi:membrane protease YdiL (CAAX protease family)
MTVSAEVTRRRDRAAVLFALTVPTLVTVLYFIVLARQPAALQLAAFGVGKLIQFAFPVIWVVGIQRTKIGWKSPMAKDLAAGAALGLALLVAALTVYFVVLKPSAGFGDAADKIQEKVAGVGVSNFPRYVAMSCFYCVIHSLAEEYYWRWFVFAQLRRLASVSTASVVSGLGFMAHHVCVLTYYFGWDSPWAYFLSFAVAVGGFIWAWMYEKTGSLYGIWVSHALVDAAIFIVGYDAVM